MEFELRNCPIEVFRLSPDKQTVAVMERVLTPDELAKVCSSYLEFYRRGFVGGLIDG